MKSLENVIDKNWQELQDLLPLITCLAGTKADKEQLWSECFRFMDQVMPTDTADCSLYLLAEDAFNAITYSDQVCAVLTLLSTHALSTSRFAELQNVAVGCCDRKLWQLLNTKSGKSAIESLHA